MREFIFTNELALRLGVFIVVFAGMATWERTAPRRALTVSRTLRWFNNLGLMTLNTLLLRLLFPIAAVGMAAFAQGQHWGLFNLFSLSPAMTLMLSLMCLDLAIYFQHQLFHAIPLLWRIHRVHHADLDIDVTTGGRFHPIEMLLSMLIKFGVIIVLGLPMLAVLIFEIMLNAGAMFNHSNARLPLRLDRVLRYFIVTPDMHRVHHSIHQDETDSNYGFNLSVWDRLFRTYRAQPRAGHEGMTIGIASLRDTQYCIRLTGMLALPFMRKQRD